MNGSEQNRRMRPEKILEMFLEVVQQHASKSYDFPISDLLEQYMHGRVVPNFPEAALVIDSAGKVFSHKVDYLEALLMTMHDRQNAPERNEKSDNNPDEAGKPTTEKKRLPGRRLKNVDHSATPIQLTSPKHIKKGTSTVEKINLNSSDTSDPDKFKNYCQAVKSKIPVFYERVNLLISDKTDSYFDGARAISKDDPDCQKNYNVFVGCISFKEKQMMSQREFLNRIQFDNLDGGFDPTNSNSPAAPDNDFDQTNPNAPAVPEHSTTGNIQSSSIVAGDATSDLLESLRETSLLLDSLANNDDCDSAMVDDDMSQLESTAGASMLHSTEQSGLMESSVDLSSTNFDSAINSTVNPETPNETTGNLSQLDVSNVNSDTVANTLNSTNGMDSTQETQHTNDTANDDTLMNSTSSNIDGTNQTNGTANDDTLMNSTLSNIDGTNQTNGTANDDTLMNSTLSNIDCTNQTNGISNDDTLMNSTLSNIDGINQTNGTSNDDTLMNSTCADEKLTPDSKVDGNGTNDETLKAIFYDSACDNTNGLGDSSNIFRIKEEYLKLDERFRLPLSVLQREVNIKLNIFGIPFGRLRRQVKFALTKDFDSLRTGIKRTRDFDECSTTTIRKFVKLNDGSATPSIEASSALPATSVCDQLPDSSIVPAPDTNTAETPPDATSQSINGTSLENGISAECSAGENAPKGDELSTTQTTLANPSELVDGVTASEDTATENLGESDGPSPPKIPRIDGVTASEDTATENLGESDGPSPPKISRIDNDALSIFDSGIGTLTEGSQCDDVDGTITNRRETLDLTPPSEQIEDEMSAEADEQSANRIREMTNLSEKVHSWHQRLKPILLHSEKRNDFDVRDTSRNIVACFSNCDSSLQTKTQSDRLVSFENIMERRNKADTARYFFSMLQMANNRNIELIVQHNDSTKLCPQNKIMLKLLNPNIREIDPNIEKN